MTEDKRNVLRLAKEGEGTCPYAGILAKGEEEVTREWLMQIISRR